MCDLLVALPDATRNGRTIFAKNSDRPSGECQVYYFSNKETFESKIQCSYVSIPNVKRKYSSGGLRPYWCWGYETGINEKGVVGGNAAIYTRSFREPKNAVKPGLTGMDLLRLGLECGADAEQVVDHIIIFLEQYGQWGSAVQGKDHLEGGYENAFLIADSAQAWVLETSGHRWVARRITKGIFTLSNQPTIGGKYDKASNDLTEYAAEKGWWRKELAPFDFALHYNDHEHYARQVSHIRWKRSNELLKRERGEITVQSMMRILRDHYEDSFLEGPQFHPFLPDFLTLCMHDSPAGFTWGDTATSLVFEQPEHLKLNFLFWLCYLPPCCGIYLPVYFGSSLPDPLSACGTENLSVWQPKDAPKDRFNKHSLWWRSYRLVKAVGESPLDRLPQLQKEYKQLENSFFHENVELKDAAAQQKYLSEVVVKVEAIIDHFEQEWRLT